MPHEDLSGRTVAAYRLLERVGEGGTASVYRAEHPDRGRCAVKVLKERMRNDPTAVKRFLREAGYGSRVHHPSVVCTYDYGEVDDLYYLALEWAAGEPLSQFVHRAGRLAPELTVELISQLAGALAAAHAEGIIHRDLKPENIVFDPATQTVKLLDFGIARDAQADEAERLTRTGFFVGTLNYVAPEALSGELVSESADIYSLATIAYYLLTGIHPYPGRSPRELFQQLLTQAPTPLNEAVPGVRFPPSLEAAIMAALARDPAARPPTVEDFAHSLRQALEAGEAIEASTPPRTEGGLLGKMRSLLRKKDAD
ncbi:MAG: serine/threonine protein kinase [Gemmatimonadota bacterium]|nr:serine/threonine protein kinase [Gemmatimonadota bacterium]